MARPREFDRDTALKRAIEVFSAHGFEGTSTPMLLEAMKIGRQSLYDTFGDKRSLYLESLSRYSEETTSGTISRLFSESSVAEGLRRSLYGFIDEAMADPARACLGVHSVAEFGTSSAEVNAINAAMGGKTQRAVEARLREGRERGEIAPWVDPSTGGGFFMATLVGLKIAARGGAGADELRRIADLALRALVVE